MKRIFILVITLALLLAACGGQVTAPAQQETDPQGMGVGGGEEIAGEFIVPDTGAGADLVGTVAAIEVDQLRAATAQIISIELTAQSQATGAAVEAIQTGAALSVETTQQALTAQRIVANATATAQQQSMAATDAAVRFEATQGAIAAEAAQAQQAAVIALQAQQTAAQQAANSKAMIGSLTTLAWAALIITSVIALLFFVGNVLQAHHHNSNIREFSGGQVVQHIDGAWLTVESTRALPAPAAPDIVIEPIIEAPETIRVTANGSSYEIPRISEEERRARRAVLRLIKSAIRFYGRDGGAHSVIPGYRALADKNLRPRTSSGWQQAVAILQQHNLVVSRAGVGTHLIGDCQDLHTLYCEIKIGKIALYPVGSKIIEHSPDW